MAFGLSGDLSDIFDREVRAFGGGGVSPAAAAPLALQQAQALAPRQPQVTPFGFQQTALPQSAGTLGAMQQAAPAAPVTPVETGPIPGIPDPTAAPDPSLPPPIIPTAGFEPTPGDFNLAPGRTAGPLAGPQLTESQVINRLDQMPPQTTSRVSNILDRLPEDEKTPKKVGILFGPPSKEKSSLISRLAKKLATPEAALIAGTAITLLPIAGPVFRGAQILAGAGLGAAGALQFARPEAGPVERTAIGLAGALVGPRLTRNLLGSIFGRGRR